MVRSMKEKLEMDKEMGKENIITIMEDIMKDLGKKEK